MRKMSANGVGNIDFPAYVLAPVRQDSDPPAGSVWHTQVGKLV